MMIQSRRAICGSIFASTGAVLIVAAVAFYPDVSGLAQAGKANLNRAAMFPAEGGKHVTQGVIGLQNLVTGVVSGEGSVATTATEPTRSSFMAGWKNVSGATGYRLDVSTSNSFRSYVSGYENMDVGNATSRTVNGLSPGTTYYYRVRAYNVAGTSGNSEVMTATTSSGSGLVINATFDSSITSDPNSAAIESMISQAIGIYESLFSDPITVSILFRYSTTEPNGAPFGSGALAQSNFVFYR